MTAILPPDVFEAFEDYVAMHAQEVGKQSPIGELAGLMIEDFLNSDAAFKRARKATKGLRHNRKQSDE